MGGTTGAGTGPAVNPMLNTANNPYAGNPLAQNSANAYTSALGQTSNIGAAGDQALGQADQYGGQAGDVYGQMTGYVPQNITAGQLSDTDLSPYMNPYQNSVIDTTMNRLNQEQSVQQQGINDASQRQNAFGGDRMYLQKGVLGGKYADTQAQTLAGLNSANFLNAQQMGTNDINRTFQADTTNQGMNANMFSGGAAGLGGLANLYGNLGSGMSQYGASNLGALSNMGFGFGNQLQQNQLAAGALQQQQQQMLMDAIKGQYTGATGQPQNSLAQYMASILNPGSYGTTKTSGSSNPGILGTIGGVAGILGAL
ncbi:MAG: hypothetical protein EHM33_00345 [Chloroflexi bacterium]|nr:MAG: hypothetical protein EHM33_00345 [Chloroflexota bacterium]